MGQGLLSNLDNLRGRHVVSTFFHASRYLEHEPLLIRLMDNLVLPDWPGDLAWASRAPPNKELFFGPFDLFLILLLEKS